MKTAITNNSRHILIFALLLLSSIDIHSQEGVELRSRRSSICSMLVKHREQEYADNIEHQFEQIPVSERYNDHNLSVRVINVDSKNIDKNAIDGFIENNKIASRLVARWFDRNILTGACTLDTIKSRGLYDASVLDMELAANSQRGKAMLEDAGEDLIGNTWLLVNDVNYIDKNKRAKLWAAIGGAVMGVLTAVGGGSARDVDIMTNGTAAIIESIKGFAVRIRTRLYRLQWDSDLANEFYATCYSVADDKIRKEAFEAMRPKFKMEYVGEVVSKGGRTSFLGVNEERPEIMIRKACARAIDENIADLAHKFEPFRIKIPITSVSPEITAPIGRKEGVEISSKFEVLEVVDNKGKIEYKRVGTVKPVAGKIWDNRYMADAEGSKESSLNHTYFIRTSGNNFYPGMLLREID